MLAGGHVHFHQPFDRQVAAVGQFILADVAGDIGELEGDAEVTGPVQRRLILRVDAHQHRHHAAHRARDMIAIAQHVGLAARSPVARIERKALQQIMGITVRNPAFTHDDAKAVKGRVAGRLAAQRRIGQHPQGRQPRLPIGHAPHRPAMILPVGDVVAFAAPGIEQPGPLARHPIEQLRRHGKALRSPRDAVASMGNQGGAIETV